MIPDQRKQRGNIRNAYLVASVDELKAGREQFEQQDDQWGVECIDEMLAECAKHKVDNFGDTPAF